MRRKYTKRKTPYSKMSIDRLKSIAEDILKQYPDLANQLEYYENEKKNIDKLSSEKLSLEIKKNDIIKKGKERRKEKYSRAGFFEKITIDENGYDLYPTEQLELDRINSKISSNFPYRFQENKYSKYYEVGERLKKINSQIEKKTKQKNKKDREKAVIASYNKKTREQANIVKKELKEQISVFPNCPYCTEPLGTKPHCDHIYPVSKGGLSHPENMVYVCSSCNQKKSDQTLNSFIRKYNMDRNRIEKMLISLGKEF